ncbi:monocarboxylate transporter 7-like [Diadema antillarum]|uniref:monocarboxylate transporter 7-like n=1 Tax=Diadema antillarum TaxID=105358 RepID=UPI003A886F94
MAHSQTTQNVSLQDSEDLWKYVVLLSKFCILFFDAGLAKSFGVLIENMVSRFDSDYKTIAFICSMPSALLTILCPFVYSLMKVVQPRLLVISGSFLCAVPLMCVPLVRTLPLLGFLFALTGFGMSIVFLSIFITLNEYFLKSFIFFNTLSTLGVTIGAFCLPVIVEWSLTAYGYNGAFLILGGMCLHTVPCSLTIRPPRDGKTLQVHPTATKENNNVLKSVDNQSTTPSASEKDFKKISVDSKSGDMESSRVSSLRIRLKSCVYFAEPLFALITPCFVFCYFFMYAWVLFLIPAAESLGIERSRAVYLASIAGFGGVVGKFGMLLTIYAKFDLILVYIICCSVCNVTIFISSVNDTYLYQALMAFTQGLTVFAFDSIGGVMTKLTVENEENVPIAFSFMAFACGIGILIGDALSGHIYDVTQSYRAVFNTLGLALLSVIVILVAVFIILRRRAKRNQTNSDSSQS